LKRLLDVRNDVKQPFCVQTPKTGPGRPKHVATFTEGPRAGANFLGAMQAILAAPKVAGQTLAKETAEIGQGKPARPVSR